MLFTMISLLALYWVAGGMGGIKRIRGSRTLSQNEDRPGLLKAGEQVQIRLQIQPPRFMPLPYIIVREHLQRHNGDSWIFEDSLVPHFNKDSILTYQTPPLERGNTYFPGRNAILKTSSD